MTTNVVNFPGAATPSRTFIQHERLDRLYGEWLASRGASVHPESTATLSEELAADERRDELVSLIAAAPAPRPFLILRKLEVLERLLEAQDHDAEMPRPEFALIASVRADIVRLEAD